MCPAAPPQVARTVRGSPRTVCYPLGLLALLWHLSVSFVLLLARNEAISSSGLEEVSPAALLAAAMATAVVCAPAYLFKSSGSCHNLKAHTPICAFFFDSG